MRAIAILALGGVLIASPALANSEKVKVSVGDTNFHSTAQVKSFYKKLNAAAVRVCTTSNDLFYGIKADPACVKATMEDAVRKVNQPLLTAMLENPNAPRYATDDR
jgi:UrcA family protein